MRKRKRTIPARRCSAQNRHGEQCKSAAMKGLDVCHAHNPAIDAAERFGSPQQAREAGRLGGKATRYPRLREIMERKLEEQADRILDAQIEALDATRLIVSEDGEAHIHPDFLTRLRAGDTLLTRAVGKPAQTVDVTAETRSVTLTIDASDPAVRSAVHDLLRSRPAIDA